MSDQNLSHYIPAQGKDGINAVKVRIYYAKGGINYFNYKEEPSAIWATITPMEVKVENGFRCEKYGFGKGLKVNLEAATRLNRKNVEKAFERVVAEITMGTGRVCDAIQQVCIHEGVTITSAAHSTVPPTT